MRRDNVPAKDNLLASFATNISTRLTATPTAFGCTSGMATQLSGLLATFVTKLAAAQNPETKGRSTIFAKNTAKTALVAYLRLVIRQIQGTGTVSDQQRLDLGINVRKTPSPPGNPGTANRLKVLLTAMGALDLSWKCTNPTGGTMYQVFRKIGTAEPLYLGGSGDKKFSDATLPAGTANVTYMIQAVRSSGVGAWADFNVKIGVSGTSPIVAATAHTDLVKLAA